MFATYQITNTWLDGSIFDPARTFVAETPRLGKIRELLQCPFCLSHWIAFILVLGYIGHKYQIENGIYVEYLFYFTLAITFVTNIFGVIGAGWMIFKTIETLDRVGRPTSDESLVFDPDNFSEKL
ncbi:MAG: DUF1360 domain-containing protein [Planctomycetaceae bacterium]